MGRRHTTSVDDLHRIATSMPHVTVESGSHGRLREVSVDELSEVIQDAWLARASPTRAERWLAERMR